MPKILAIITDPNPILRKQSKEISDNKISSAGFRELCLDMIETMVKKDGVGLSAPQVKENIRLIVVNTKEGPVCMINPKISKKSWLKEWGEEGCLSVPGVFGQVKRHRKILYHYYNNQGNKIKKDAKGFLARIIQHEIDHLNGILFIDKAKEVKKVE